MSPSSPRPWSPMMEKRSKREQRQGQRERFAQLKKKKNNNNNNKTKVDWSKGAAEL